MFFFLYTFNLNTFIIAIGMNKETGFAKTCFFQYFDKDATEGTVKANKMR